MQGLALLEAQHAGILSPKRGLSCIAVVFICCVVFDLRQMLSLLCPRQHFKPNPTRGHSALSHQ